MLPSEFRRLESSDAAELHAHYTVEKEIEGYYNSEQARKIESKKTK